MDLPPCSQIEQIWQFEIGIVGGLGPHAHIRFERHLLHEASRLLGRPLADQEFPVWTLVSRPHIADRSAHLLHSGASPLPELLRACRGLSSCGVIVVPCYTAHAYFEELGRQCPVPLLDMVAAGLRELKPKEGEEVRVGVLASAGSYRANLFETAAARISPGLQILRPSSVAVEQLMGVIYGGDDFAMLEGGIKAGGHRRARTAMAMRRRLADICLELRSAGAERLLLGCTELPLLLEEAEFCGMPVVDGMRSVARLALRLALRTGVMPAVRDESKPGPPGSRYVLDFAAALGSVAD